MDPFPPAGYDGGTAAKGSDASVQALLAAADERDRVPEERDRRAEARDRAAERRPVTCQQEYSAAALDRGLSAVDRFNSGVDRDHGASDRAELMGLPRGLLRRQVDGQA